jgi:predicted ATP-grasp superfamily ATP-dependent carboligase
MTVHDEQTVRPATAVVMNMFYTGVGIARSLGERGIPVVGLTAERGTYGNFTRYAEILFCADSRDAPERLLAELLELGQRLGRTAVLFPTRDHDLVFLDRFRRELEAAHFIPVIPEHDALERCLDKWETYRWATQAGVPTPKCWLIERPEDLPRVAQEATYPCVLKPVAAHHWRTGNNWNLVGGRKAIAVASPEELTAEYGVTAGANRRVLVQQHIAGGDDALVVTACYIDRRSKFQAGFNIQKLVQVPVGFGTGCIVQSVQHPELFDRTIRLLGAMQFTGIAEVEYKWNSAEQDYQLIEVNPRPWDQHRVGAACGVDLIHLAYCDAAGLAKPDVAAGFVPVKWIAEDAFLMAALRFLWRRERGLGALLRNARGRKVYAIWSARDPLPFAMYVARLIPQLAVMGFQAVRRLSRLGSPVRAGAGG